MTFAEYLERSQGVFRAMAGHPSALRVGAAVEAIADALGSDRPLLVCGNGGSAADAMHITGELVGRFALERRALNCICLSSDVVVLTAWSNDYSFDSVFSRQVEAYGVPGGVLLGLSTSGNSSNVVDAFVTARHRGLTTVALTGEGGGKLGPHADILLDVPSVETPLIQQVHISLYHYICSEVEAALAG